MSVCFIQKLTGRGGENTNNIPRLGARFVRYISPVDCSSGVRATSNWIVCPSTVNWALTGSFCPCGVGLGSGTDCGGGVLVWIGGADWTEREQPNSNTPTIPQVIPNLRYCWFTIFEGIGGRGSFDIAVAVVTPLHSVHFTPGGEMTIESWILFPAGVFTNWNRLLICPNRAAHSQRHALFGSAAYRHLFLVWVGDNEHRLRSHWIRRGNHSPKHFLKFAL